MKRKERNSERGRHKVCLSQALGSGDDASHLGAYANLFMNGGEVFKFAVRAVPTVSFFRYILQTLTRTCGAACGTALPCLHAAAVHAGALRTCVPDPVVLAILLCSQPRHI